MKFILGISAFYHDSAACLLRDGGIIAAAQEERFSRIKNDAAFPEKAIRFCLDFAGINLGDVTQVVFYEKPFVKFERLVETYAVFAPKGLWSFWKAMPLWIREKLFQKKTIIRRLKNIDENWQPENLLFTNHHQAHAASAYYPSPFEKAVVLTVDGVGEWTTTSISLAEGNRIKPKLDIRFPHSIGLLYSAFTYYLGFKVNSDEYKVMGLAPYGKPVFADKIRQEMVRQKADGSFRLNMKYFSFASGLRMTNKNFNEFFGAPVRKTEEKLTVFHCDIAASIQLVAEELLLGIASFAYKKYGFDNLCLAGGVALNCVANGRILRESGFKNIWIQPAAGDAGGALGAAMTAHFSDEKTPIKKASDNDAMKQALLGPSYSGQSIKEMLRQKGQAFTEMDDEECCRYVAKALDEGKVVGWFKGRMEFGPRALGNRSILGDARNPDMQQRINQKIKFRESFRPFAPAVLEEFAIDYFQLSAKSPYMLLVAEIAEKQKFKLGEVERGLKGFEKLKAVRSTIPSATHVDDSARIQTVGRESHPEFYRLISAFYKLTGCPLILNTSFNVKDEPIVCSPEDALNGFLKTDMDVLIMENCIVWK